jgi:hypothetical protein
LDGVWWKNRIAARLVMGLFAEIGWCRLQLGRRVVPSVNMLIWALFWGVVVGSYEPLAGVLAFLLSLAWQELGKKEKMIGELTKELSISHQGNSAFGRRE